MRIEKKLFRTLRFALSLFCIGYTFAAFSNDVNDTTLVNNLLEKANSLINTSPEESDRLARITLSLSEKNHYEEGIASSALIIATNLRIANHNIPAIENYYRSLNYYQKRNDSLMMQEIYQWLGLCLAHESFYDSGKVYLNKSLTIAQKTKNYSGEAQANLNMARLYKSIGLYHESLRYCHAALGACDLLNNPELRWKIKNFTGYIYLQGNMHKEAIEIFNETARDIYLYPNQPEEIYRLLYYISQLNSYLKEYAKAKQNLIQSIEAAKKIKNKQLSTYFIGLTHRALGEIYNLANAFDSAYYYYNLALMNKELTLDKHAEGQIIYCLGDLYYKENKPDSALKYFKESAKIHSENKEIDRLLWANLGLGKTYYNLNKKKLAKKYLSYAANEEIDEQNMEVLAESARLLSIIYDEENNFRRAYEYFKIYKNASDELFNADKVKKIAQLELENDFEDREQKLKYDREQEKIAMEARIKQNKIVRNFSAGGLVMTLALLLFIYRSYKQKQKSNFEKEILLKEIHHRVKNNLQIISSMLSLQGNYLSDQKIKDAVNESQGRVKSMALIHQMLYQHDKFSSLDIKEYIGQLVDSISASFDPGKKKISTILKIEQIFIDIDTAIPLGLIVNELLTNAYKYAFPDERKGTVAISLRKENDEKFNLVIKDNGIGLPEKNQIAKQSKSLGLNMVNILTRQIKGDLHITVSEGTQFNIHFAEVIRLQKNIH